MLCIYTQCFPEEDPQDAILKGTFGKGFLETIRF